jgi:hypothetical protein
LCFHPLDSEPETELELLLGWGSSAKVGALLKDMGPPTQVPSSVLALLLVSDCEDTLELLLQFENSETKLTEEWENMALVIKRQG